MHRRRLNGFTLSSEMRRRICRLLLAGTLLLCDLVGQTDSPEALNGRLVHAYQAKDYPTFLVLSRQLLAVSPGDPRAIYNVASGEALAGDAAQSFRLLERLLQMHLDLGAEKDPDFAELRKSAAWTEYADHLKAMRQPVVQSSLAFSLPDKGMIASSVAFDAVRGDTFVGSARERKVLKRIKDGSVSEFLSEKDGLLGVSSLLLDQTRNQLLIGTSAFPFMHNFKKEDEGKAALFVVDLLTGKILRSAFLAVPGEHHIVMQMTQDQKGNLFVVDSGSSEIRRLRRSSSELELFISSVVFRAPRGLALSSDDRTLYVIDSDTGLWAVDVLSNDRKHIDSPESIWMGGMSGLLRFEKDFVSLQAGFTPARIVRIRLDAKQEKVLLLDTLESNNSVFNSPLLGNLANKDLLFIANSQAELVDAKTHLVMVDNSKPTMVLQLPLGK